MLLTHAKGGPNLSQVVARGVSWVHAYGTGVDGFPFAALGDRVLTCSRGASAVPIAEWVLAVMLAAEKKLPESWIHEPPAHWSVAGLGGLHGRTLGLLGLGGIGEQVAHWIEERTGKEARNLVLGHLQRGGSPTSYDRLIALRFGAAAVRLVAERRFGTMVALDPPEIRAVPIADAIQQLKRVPTHSDIVQTARDLGTSFGD